MKRLYLYVSFAAFLLSMSVGFAQHLDQAAREDFIFQASEFSKLFAGRIAEEYPNVYTETYYIYSRRFIEGSLCYEGKRYQNVFLNINAEKQQLYALAPDKRHAVVLDPLLVSELVLDGEVFVYFAQGVQPGLSAGFYSVLWDGGWRLLKYVRKKYREYVDTQIRELVRTFEVSTQYYLIKDGKIHSLSGRKSLIKALGSHKRELTRWSAPVSASFKESPDDAYVQYLRYYASLQTPE